MTLRRGRRLGRTLLNPRQADARRRAIAKVDRPPSARPPRILIGFDGSRTGEVVTVMAATPDGRVHRLDAMPAPPQVELLGHHLQRAAAENA